eukprot:TRINITY_DN6661_c1_g1_i3.p1 TRINITY_DN6661_c1_g1~~TRINITY_DN6661_c1_g1_i3.p1  ORF type:complete len:266 (+),score=58.36 TRINITY_DN6661_c1_g1_i3:92-889(+)
MDPSILKMQCVRNAVEQASQASRLMEETVRTKRALELAEDEAAESGVAVETLRSELKKAETELANMERMSSEYSATITMRERQLAETQHKYQDVKLQWETVRQELAAADVACQNARSLAITAEAHVQETTSALNHLIHERGVIQDRHRVQVASLKELTDLYRESEEECRVKELQMVAARERRDACRVVLNDKTAREQAAREAVVQAKKSLCQSNGNLSSSEAALSRARSCEVAAKSAAATSAAIAHLTASKASTRGKLLSLYPVV